MLCLPGAGAAGWEGSRKRVVRGIAPNRGNELLIRIHKTKSRSAASQMFKSKLTEKTPKGKGFQSEVRGPELTLCGCLDHNSRINSFFNLFTA